jgi:hypothetical protein
VFCYPCLQAFVPFDGAKVRRLFHPAMDFILLCAETVPIFDQNQKHNCSISILPFQRKPFFSGKLLRKVVGDVVHKAFMVKIR